MVARTGILKNSPLIYMLASIRFASWPLFEKKIDEVLDELRDTTPIIQSVQIVNKVGADGFPLTVKKDEAILQNWILMPNDRSYAIQFAPDQLLVFCKKYTQYNEFEKIFKNALRVLEKHMRFIDVSSMGVRYIDHIRCQNGEKLKDYIDSSFLPPDIKSLNTFGGAVTGVYKSGEIELRVKSISKPDALSVPDDLISMLAMTQDPGIPLRIRLIGDSQMLLDIDSIQSSETPVRMAKPKIISGLKLLHNEANSFFRNKSVCTDHAFNVWGKEVTDDASN